MAVGGQRCTATDSSRVGKLSYPFSSMPPSEVRAEEEEARRQNEYGACQDLIISSWTSGKNGEAR